MKRLWPTEALAFEESVDASLASLGGIEFTRECEREPSLRQLRLGAAIGELGLGELDFRDGEIEASAAALASRAAGRVVAPWPLPQQLAAGTGSGAEIHAVYLVSAEPRRVDHLDLIAMGLAIDVRSGVSRELTATGARSPMPIDPFGVPCRLGTEIAAPELAVAAEIVMSGFWVLGALETSVSLASSYALERSQFGRPIADFGAIQWRLADLSGAFSALAELATFSLAKLIDRTVTLADVFALRLQTLESAETVLANAHQVLGAIGLCEEHDLVVIDRHLQSTLRRPSGIAQTGALLAERVRDEGFDSLYPVAPRGTISNSRLGDDALASS